ELLFAFAKVGGRTSNSPIRCYYITTTKPLIWLLKAFFTPTLPQHDKLKYKKYSFMVEKFVLKSVEENIK
ncbi:hypothetical protein, partial [Streptomyces asiaticus]|uniref:hypothetical protein n=1 Tax=Streptomyces asiaticus TaxID=114695 RepID=UPI0031CF6851